MIKVLNKKIKSKKGGAGIIIVMMIVLVVFIGTLPSIIDVNTIHMTNKKLKSHINAAANSAVITTTTIQSSGLLSYDVVASSAKVDTFFESVFGTTLTQVTTPTSNAQYYSVTYKNTANTISVQYIWYHSNTGVKEPQAGLINPSIKTNSLGQSVDVSKVVGTVSIPNKTAIIIVRYDMDTLTGGTTSILRYGASQLTLE